MKLILGFFFYCALMALCAATCPGQSQASAVDYQHVAEITVWTFHDDAATAESCVQSIGETGYQADIVKGVDMPWTDTIHISKDHHVIYQWECRGDGTRWCTSVFTIAHDILYYALPQVGDQGGNIIAINLQTGSQVWNQPLTGLPPVAHSQYVNRLNIAVANGTVQIYGKESSGNYLELKDTSTGVTIGKRIYENAK